MLAPPPPPPPPSSGATVAPGESWQTAYNNAAAGAVITVLAGSHGSQAISGTKRVTFLGQAGNKMRVLDVHAPLVLDGIHIDSGMTNPGNAGLGITQTSGVVFKNGSVGNIADTKGVYLGADNVTFDNVRFHDVVMTSAGSAAGVHNECIYALEAEGLTVRDSVFTNCSVMDLFFTACTWCGS